MDARDHPYSSAKLKRPITRIILLCINYVVTLVSRILKRPPKISIMVRINSLLLPRARNGFLLVLRKCGGGRRRVHRDRY